MEQKLWKKKQLVSNQSLWAVLSGLASTEVWILGTSLIPCTL